MAAGWGGVGGEGVKAGRGGSGHALEPFIFKR